MLQHSCLPCEGNEIPREPSSYDSPISLAPMRSNGTKHRTVTGFKRATAASVHADEVAGLVDVRLQPRREVVAEHMKHIGSYIAVFCDFLCARVLGG